MTDSIVLGGGCFWCLEAAYQLVDGVESVTNGYAGGIQPNPHYESVAYGMSDHAEVVRVEFDPIRISLTDILNIFWLIHDPTSLNRQGADTGSQYRSTILTHSPGQRSTVDISVTEAQSQLDKPIVTVVDELETFYPAKDYHQNYFVNYPEQGYCQIVIEPKLTKLRQHFSEKLRSN